ncbi:MAG: OmpA family protein [Cytophagales bacterium]
MKILFLIVFWMLSLGFLNAQYHSTQYRKLNNCSSMRAYGGGVHREHHHKENHKHEPHNVHGHYTPVSYAKKPVTPPTSKTEDKHQQTFKTEEEVLRDHHLENEKPIILPPIQFIFNMDEINVANFDSFIQAVEYAKNGYMVLIEGHTDDRGSEEYNMKLSMKRVEKIRRLMIDMGVDDDKISAIGYGESMPIVPNDSEENRQKNRRIEFKAFKL